VAERTAICAGHRAASGAEAHLCATTTAAVPRLRSPAQLNAPDASTRRRGVISCQGDLTRARTVASAPGAPPAATEIPKAPVPGQIVVQDANTILAKDLIGQTVYAPDKAKIGSISDLILSKDAKTVEGFVIGVGALALAKRLSRLKRRRRRTDRRRS
jgi:sporulation protein YlmC with PRC-barrel domain